MVLVGVITYFVPVSYSHKYSRYIDLTGFNKPYGIALALAGIFILWKSRSISVKYVNMICPKCEEAFKLGSSSGNRCPKCGAALEPLDGFYERHPECKADEDSEQGDGDNK